MPASPRRPAPRSDSLAWPGLCLALAAGSVAVWLTGSGPELAWRATLWWQRPWTLWSASLAHLSGAHLLANLVALLALALLGRFLRVGRGATLAVLLAWPLATLALLAWPQVAVYSGMSGLLNAIAAVLWSQATLRDDCKAVSYVIFGALVLKLGSEHAWSQPIAFDPNWGFNVVYAAHFTGAVAGAASGLAVAAVVALRAKRRV
ncbi:MAG: rhomboid family intramembrane serine protease [Burkholderiaceae bacterium]